MGWVGAVAAVADLCPPLSVRSSGWLSCLAIGAGSCPIRDLWTCQVALRGRSLASSGSMSRRARGAGRTAASQSWPCSGWCSTGGASSRCRC